MRIVTLEKSAKMSAIVTQSYRIEGAGSVAARKQAEAALLQANPHLAGLSSVPAGTVVLVPEVPGLARLAEATPADEAAAALAGVLRHGLDEIGDQVTGAAKRDVEAVAESQRLLKLRELRALVANQAPQANELLATLEADLKEQAKEGERLLKTINQTQTRLSADLAELEKSRS